MPIPPLALILVKKLQSEGKAPEDESFKAQDAVQKMTDKYIKDIDQILESKNKELTEFS